MWALKSDLLDLNYNLKVVLNYVQLQSVNLGNFLKFVVPK